MAKFKQGDEVVCTGTGQHTYITERNEYTVLDCKTGYLGTRVVLKNDNGFEHSYEEDLFELKQTGKFNVGDVIECSSAGAHGLTSRKQYKVTKHGNSPLIVYIINDFGREDWFGEDHFKLVKENNMKQHIQAREFIVGSVGINGLSFSAFPSWHPNEAKAKAEAERLAKLHTDKTFIWVQVKGGAKAVQIETF